MLNVRIPCVFEMSFKNFHKGSSMKKFILGLISVIGLTLLMGCSNADKTRQTLVASGFTQIETKGWSFMGMGCGKDDTYCTKFTAVNPLGMKVSGVVGCGLFVKGCTVRF